MRLALLGVIDLEKVGIDGCAAALGSVRAAAAREDDRATDERADQGQPHGAYLISSTVETLPSAWAKTSLTRPFVGANQQVRVPLPYG